MASCLGLYIEDNLIKYAKVSKDNDKVKVEAYGLKFFEDNIEKTIEQIVKETFSFKIPISTNISKEKYTNLKIFSLLRQADEKKAINTEFEYFCNEKNKNRLVMDYRCILTKDSEDQDKKNVLYSYTDKGNIAERLQTLDKYRISNISPIALTLPNICPKGRKGKNLIINIENETNLILLTDETPVMVETLDMGMGKVLEDIAERENSLSKAYEICKNTTLYTSAGRDLQSDSNEYIDKIVPALYNIIEKTKEFINKNNLDITNIYISGLGTAINNIDLYFQENFLSQNCEILTPYFIDKTNLKVNVKDYIELNSAISLGLQGLIKTKEDINFNSKSVSWGKISEVLKSDVNFNKTTKVKKPKTSLKNAIKVDSHSGFDVIEKNLLRTCIGVGTIFISYIIITVLLSKGINNKIAETQEVIIDTKEKMSINTKYITALNSRTNDYESILQQIEEATNETIKSYSRKNIIPNFLSKLMYAIPEEVQILSIENSTEKHIIIQAQSAEYQYLGYLKSALDNGYILTNVTSTSGVRESGMIKVTIEGDLAY